MWLEYWYLFPMSIVIATISMASGVEGATFFAPLFLLGLGLPADVLGSLAVPYARPEILQVILGMGLIGVALSFLTAPDGKEIVRLDAGIAEEFGGTGGEQAETVIHPADGEEIRYTVCNRTEGRLIAGLGALFMGAISTGLGELNGYFLLRRCRVPSRVAVGTGVVVVAVTALSAATVHMWRFAETGGDAMDTVLRLALFTVPGVVVGGQLGPRLAARVSQHVLERGLGILFVLVGLLMLAKVAFAL
jgi:uncharacterized membrane protein YfcA